MKRIGAGIPKRDSGTGRLTFRTARNATFIPQVAGLHRTRIKPISPDGNRQGEQTWLVSLASTSRRTSASSSRCSTFTGSVRSSHRKSSRRSAFRQSVASISLTDAEVLQIRETIDRDYQVEGDLRRETSMNIKRLMDLGCYRGLRHRRVTAGSRPAHAYQCPHPQGSGQGDRRQEEVSSSGRGSLRRFRLLRRRTCWFAHSNCKPRWSRWNYGGVEIN